MTRRDDAQLTDKMPLPGAAASDGQPAQDATCPCEEFQSNQVCDHVLMAAAVRMVRRMIDIHADPEVPH